LKGRHKGQTKKLRYLSREAKGLPHTISKSEWKETLTKAKVVGTWLSAWLAFDCIFGKRANEICKLKRLDAHTSETHLFVTFHVGKKRSRVGPIDSNEFFKSKTLKHYAMPYIIEYLKEWDDWNQTSKVKSLYLFPENRAESTHTVHRKFLNGKGEEVEKDYTYKVEGGYIHPSKIYRLVVQTKNAINPNMWLHLGRTTIGTRMAENGYSQFDIAPVLDVSPRTAVAYAEHGTAKTRDWNEEET
jgi:integrase